MDIPREESVLSVAFFDQFGTKMLVIDEEVDTAKSLHEETFILNCDPNLVADEAWWHCYG